VDEKPRLRPVEAFVINHENQAFLCLRDPSGIAENPVLLSPAASLVLALLDGEHSLLDIQCEWVRRFGEIIPRHVIADLVNALDRAYLLESPTFTARLAQIRDEFRASSYRAAAHAGVCYAGEPEALRKEIRAYFDAAAATDHESKPVRADPPRGLIAPHIDPRRGGRVYARVYAELVAQERPQLFVILGTAHCGVGPELFAATMKDYATPLGVVRTDRDFVARLADSYRAGDLYADELLHRNEHSIEFQALFLAATIGIEDYQIVPILVGSFHQYVAAGRLPIEDEKVGAFVKALRQTIANDGRRVCIIAGVDFAHVGRKFGDPHGVGADVLDWIKREDLALIGDIEQVDAEGFFTRLARERDRRRICGLSPMYVLLELLRGYRGRLLAYDIAVDKATDSAVSFAGLVFD